MNTVTNQQLHQAVDSTIPPLQVQLAKKINFPSLESEIRTVIPTEEAAYHLNRQCQTLRAWACLEKGPLLPVRINGRLAWKVADIKALLSGGK